MKRLQIQDLPSDDILDKAGWLYADIFLGLMIVFLATVTFTPTIQNQKPLLQQSSARNQGAIPNSSIYAEGLAISSVTPDINQIKNGISNFIKSISLPSNSKITYFEVVGHFNAQSETSQQGMSRAIKFALDLKSQDPALMNSIPIGISSSSATPDSEVTLKVTFGSNK